MDSWYELCLSKASGWTESDVKTEMNTLMTLICETKGKAEAKIFRDDESYENRSYFFNPEAGKVLKERLLEIGANPCDAPDPAELKKLFPIP